MDRIINAIAGRRPRSGDTLADHTITVHQDGGVATLSLSELDERARAVAAWLRRRGIGAGDRIGIVARNRLEWILLDLAALKIKAVTAGFDHSHFAPTQALADAYGLKAIFTDRDTDCPAAADIRSLSGLPPAAGEEEAPHYDDEDVTTIKFTSGSTGVPKGLGATAASIDSSISAVQELFRHGAEDRLFVFLPLSLLQQRYWIYSALYYGHDVVVATYELAFHALRRERPTVVMGVPSFFDAIWKQAEAKLRAAGADPGDLDRRRSALDALLGDRVRYLWTGSAPANPAMLRFFHDAGVPIFEGYGMNETCIVTKNHPGHCRIGSAGKPVPGKEIHVGEGGMLYVRSRHPVNRRYLFGEPGASERIFLPDGSVATGDLARIDEDGYLYITGRADDVVALGNGKNVPVRPIEERIKSFPAVEECVLFGAGRPFLLAVVSAAAGGTRDGIAAHIEDVNRTLGKDERVGGFIVAPNPFSIANGLLTSQYKPRRKAIFDAYAEEINRAYGDKA